MSKKLDKNVEGHCHLCGNWNELSYDHVPPKAAGNRNPVLRADFVRAMEVGLDGSIEDLDAEKEQQGAGYYSLCRECNKNMGIWYVEAYARWAKQAMESIAYAQHPRLVFFEYDIHPLRCLKQVLSMFFSINNEKLRELYPSLADFVMDKDSQDLPTDVEIFAYLTASQTLRYMGVTGQIRKDKGLEKIITLSELSFYPFGFVLCLKDSPAPDDRLFSINYFAQYRYNDRQKIYLRLHELPVLLALPGDYRSEAEIQANIVRAKLQTLGLVPPL